MKPIYLDWNATAPPLQEAIDAYARASREAWGNPASVHGPGRAAWGVVEDARERVAALLGTHPRDVIFTSGGTEANNLAIRSLARGAQTIVCSQLEHPSVMRVVEDLAVTGAQVRWLPAEASGRVEPAWVEEALRTCDGASAVVIVQAVNHETGVIQPVEEIIGVARRRGARIHVDAVQAVGKVAGLSWRDADTVAVAAHKIRGPKGIGAVGGAACSGLTPLLRGGTQELGVRPGTVSAPLAAGFGAAALWAMAGPARYDSLRPVRDDLERALVALGAQVNGTAPRVPHVTNLSFAELRGDELVAALDAAGVAVSSGSACSAGTAERSAVVAAMVGEERAEGAVRVSLGETTTPQAIAEALVVWNQVLARGRGMDEVLREGPFHS